jgi:hypothetical protein
MYRSTSLGIVSIDRARCRGRQLQTLVNALHQHWRQNRDRRMQTRVPPVAPGGDSRDPPGRTLDQSKHV